MIDASPLVLSRARVAVVSLIAAMPLVLLIVGQRFRTPVTDVYIALVFGFLWSSVCAGAFLLLLMTTVEAIGRYMMFVGLRRLPWFSFVLTPGIVLTYLAALSGASPSRMEVLIQAGFAMCVCQVIGQLSLLQNVHDDPRRESTRPYPRNAIANENERQGSGED